MCAAASQRKRDCGAYRATLSLLQVCYCKAGVSAHGHGKRDE